MIRVELSKLVRRPRTWVTIALLAGLPVVVGIFVKASGLAPAPGEGPALLSEVLNNGLLFPAAALAIILPLFLPIAVSVIGGDTVAGEASNGTLRYLLSRPVSRNRLLVAKLTAVVAFIFLAVIIVALVAFAAGVVLFGIEPLSSISATPLSPAETAIRTILAILYIGWSMLGLGSIALFASTRTDSPLAASLATLAAFVASQVLDLIEATHSIQAALPVTPDAACAQRIDLLVDRLTAAVRSVDGVGLGRARGSVLLFPGPRSGFGNTFVGGVISEALDRARAAADHPHAG
ncbi:MAG: ABC transporter permease subunit [Actinomycetota bacterium]